ncbi:MAG: MFS transporter [Candidatus Aenigmarchaeota archaeon]|nr:MFS transporter [Candidatus Aenigmarchaeota archaeon]
MKRETLNYRLMLSSNGIAYFAFSLIGPFFVLFINQIGGSIENLGMLYGVSVLASSVTTYLVGRFSDKFGRKPFLLVSSFLSSLIIILYLYVQNLSQLYILQAANGINTAIWQISENTFMADITHRKTRGRVLGFYNMVLGIISAVALMLGGFVVSKFGFSVIFWFVGITSFISAIILFFLKEKRWSTNL